MPGTLCTVTVRGAGKLVSFSSCGKDLVLTQRQKTLTWGRAMWFRVLSEVGRDLGNENHLYLLLLPPPLPLPPHLPPLSFPLPPLLPPLFIIVIIIQWIPVFKGENILADNSSEAVKG